MHGTDPTGPGGDAAMDVDEAVAVATGRLRAMERPDLPLRLDPATPWAQRSWCYVFSFNSVAFLDHDDVGAFIPTGALVVNKDRSDVWITPSAFPVDQALDQYERQHGYTGG